MKCPICKKEMKAITNTHMIYVHGMTIKEAIKKYPEYENTILSLYRRLGRISNKKNKENNRGIYAPNFYEKMKREGWGLCNKEVQKRIHDKLRKEKKSAFYDVKIKRENAYKTHEIMKKQKRTFWSSEFQREQSRKSIATGWRKRLIIPKKDSSIEVKIQNFLKQLGIEFYTHSWINDIEHKYRCDILIPSKNLVIECDGDYWHKYPIGNEIDHIRTSELIERGFKILRLWEREIKVMDINKFKEKLNQVSL